MIQDILAGGAAAEGATTAGENAPGVPPMTRRNASMKVLGWR
jgi:hypothetical protein